MKDVFIPASPRELNQLAENHRHAQHDCRAIGCSLELSASATGDEEAAQAERGPQRESP